MSNKGKKDELVPRYVVMFQDNVTGANIAVGSDDPLDFWKPLPKEYQQPGVGNEVQRVFKAFMRKVRVMEGKRFPIEGEIAKRREEKSDESKKA